MEKFTRSFFTKKHFLFLLFVCISGLSSAQVKINSTNYPNLREAFNGINAGHYTGQHIVIEITGNTVENEASQITYPATPTYQSITIRPSGTGNRTISFANIPSNSKALYFANAHDITIDGMNQLSIISPPGHKTIELQYTEDVTIKNCKIFGDGAFGAVVYIHGTGFSGNYLIQNCEIGPFDINANIPPSCLYVDDVKGLTIENNVIHDFADPAIPSAAVGIDIRECRNLKVKNNRIYQSMGRFSHVSIGISLTDILVSDFETEISGNEIGGSAMPVPGISYELCANFQGIAYYGSPDSTGFDIPIKYEGNNIRDITLFGNNAGPQTSHQFHAINVTNGSATINNNNITNIKDWSYNTGSTTLYCIQVAGKGTQANITNNVISGIEAYTPSASIEVELTGIDATGNSDQWADAVTCTGNTIGGTDTNSFRNDSQHADSNVTGISIYNRTGIVGNNTIRNMISYGVIEGVLGIRRSYPTAIGGIRTTSGNIIYGLTNGRETDATEVTGIKQASYVSNNYPIISENQIYGLSSASSNPAAQINGIYTFVTTGDMFNNMISMTAPVNAAEINGIKAYYSFADEVVTTYIHHNSVYVGGNKTSGSSPSRACYLTGSGIPRYRVYNNIFFNARTNVNTSTAKHYGIEVKQESYEPSKFRANLYYGTGNGYVLGKAGTDKPTLAEWVKPFPYDDSGYVGNPGFINVVGYPPDLHINPTTPTLIESNGIEALPAVTVDFDNQARAGLTPHDIGADAGNFTPFIPPVITAVNATALCTNSTLEITGSGLADVTEAKIGNTVMSIASANSASLLIDTGNVPLSGSLTVTNPSGSVTYPTAITIYAAPVITQQPVSVTACASSPVSFTVAATNAVSYQWRRNGADLANDGVYSNVNTATLNISNAGSVPYGSTFTVAITGTANACTIVSSGATLMADLLPRPVISASGPTTICQGGSVTLSTNYNGPALQFFGQYFDFPRHVNYDFTVEYWVRTTQTGGSGLQWYNGQGIVDARMSNLPQQCEFGTSLVGNKLAFGIGGFNFFGNYSPTTVLSNTPINTGQWIHVAVTRKESTGELRIYLNGVLDAVGFTSLRGAIITPNMRVGGLQTGGNFFNGGIDDIRVWHYVRSQSQILSGMSHSFPGGTGGLAENFPLNENAGFSTVNLATGAGYSFFGSPAWVNRSTASSYAAYTWSNGAHTPTINVTTPGNYSVTVTDQDGCSASWIPMTVTVQSVSVAPSAPTVCQGTPTTLTASGAVSYTWSPPTGLNTTVGSSVIATPAATTTYTVLGTMASGCQTARQVTVTVNPAITISASQLNIMSGGSATLTASGGSGYTWSPAAGLNTASGASVIATPSVTTTYTVTSAACGNSAAVTVKILPEFSASNNALDFDGTDDYVSIPAQASTVNGSFTVEAWVRPTDPTKRMHVISSRNGQDRSFDIQIKDGNTIHADIGDGTSWLTTVADATFNYPVNTWAHIAYVVTPTDYKIYANGNLAGSGALSGTPMLYSPTRFFTIGKNTTENTFFQGTMDDIRIYSVALSQAQIQSDILGDYQTSELKAYFSCNEGIAGGNNEGIDVLVDQNVPGNFHGTLHNFALSGSTSNWVEGQGAQPQLQPQAIDFQPLPDVVYGDADFNLAASATSGLPISYSSSNPDVATIIGNTVTIHGAGTTEITATQVGDAIYMAADSVSQTLNVAQKPITLVDVIVADKIYDRNTSAAIAGNISGIVGSDEVFVMVMAEFASFDAGNGIPVTMQMTLEGADSANYSISPPEVTGNIFPKTLTVPGAAADNKVYDGTTAATITGSLSGIISPDVVAITSNAGVFDSPDVGSNIPVTAEMILGGASAGNYVLEQPSGLSANITAGELTAAMSGTATICDGQSTVLTLTIIGGAGPYTVQYTDGSMVYTVSNYNTGDSIEVSPVVTTSYTLVSVSDANSAADLSGTIPVTVTVNPNATYYADEDNDGYGNPSVNTTNCTGLPLGYVTNDGDCDDTRDSVHPGAVEIGYNLIDDNCDGLTDEGFPPKLTVIQSAMCAATLASIDSQLIANLVAGAQGYRWKITTMNGPTAGQVQQLDTPLRTMKLTQLVNYAFNTQYKVELAVLFAGFWQPFTPSGCTVTTPSPTTALSSCGQTLTSMANVIYANLVPYASGYRFRITDPANAANMQVIERNVREFRMNLIANFAVQYGKIYNVEVSVKNSDGTWLPYGAICNVMTPAFPTTSLQDSQCDNYAVSTNATPIYAIAYPGAVAYVFQISGSGLPAPIEVTKSTRSFTLNDFAGLLPGATYDVKVRLIFNHADPAGPFGKVCTVVTPGLSRQVVVKKQFDAIAHPNPFADDFNIDVRTASAGQIHIKVYDMTGRLLSGIIVKATDEIRLGGNFPSGVYTAIITQDSDTKTLRIIKR